MKGLFALLGVGAAAGIWWWVSQKKEVKAQSQFSIIKATFKPGFFNDDVILHCQIVNPSTGSLSFQSFTADLLYSNIVLGKINYLQSFEIKPVSSSSIDIPLTLNNAKLLTVAPELFKSGFKNTTLRAVGKVNTSFGVFPIDEAVPVL